MNLDLVVSASSLQLLIRIGVQRGLTTAECLEGSGLDVHALQDPLAEVTVRQEYAAMRNVLHHCGSEPALGVLAGSQYHIGLHGMWGLLMVTGRTLRESLEVALPYSDLGWSFTTLSFREADDTAIVSIDGSDVPPDVRPFLVERISAASKVFHREMLGIDLPFTAVHYRHSAPSDTSPYVALFGIEPTFEAEDNSVRFDSDHLDIPLPQGNEWARRGYEAICLELLDKQRSRAGVAGSVRQLLVQSPHQIPDAGAVAAKLNMSPRTLFRRLEDEATSFRILVDEVRETLAQELLRGSEMTVAHVAHRVGYADPPSFVRAFKRWKGETPQEFRARSRRSGDS